MKPVTRSDRRRDDGSVLIFVMVLMVIGSLAVLPLLSYSSTVFKANHVLSDRTAEVEAAKSGLRMALAEPVDLFQACDGSAGINSPKTLALPTVNQPARTTCSLLGTAQVRDNASLPWSIVLTQAGSQNPSDGKGTMFAGSGSSDVTAWQQGASVDGAAATVWMPNLPVKSQNNRSATPYAMPASYVINGYTACNVYFPGTYKQPVALNGPTYFASGVYYFEAPVTVTGGADVVVGMGAVDGCADDQYAAFYAPNAPVTHNITGLGATFVFGEAGRLVVDDTAGNVSFRMNQRYVKDGDSPNLASRMVSIMTVNGRLDPVLAASDFKNSGLPLSIAGKLDVPLSLVSGGTATDGTALPDRPAPVDQYRPSTLTPATRQPNPPTGVTVADRNGAALVSWTAPASDGGSPITGYNVSYRLASTPTAAATPGCTTVTLTSCLVPNLTNATAYAFVVTATNAVGTSSEATPVNATPTTSSPSIGSPTAPNQINIVVGPLPQVSAYKDAFEVTWSAPANAGNSVVHRYDVWITGSSGSTFTCTTTGATMCAVPVAIDPLLIPTETFSIRVEATIRRADNSLATSNQTNNGFLLDPLGGSYTAPPTAPVTEYQPDPVVDVKSTGANTLTVFVPGYVAVPQGVVRVDVASAGNKSVAIEGGVLASRAVLSATRPASFSFGLVNPEAQRIIRLVTTVDDSPVRSEAIVQVNATGAWAVNSWSVG